MAKNNRNGGNQQELSPKQIRNAKTREIAEARQKKAAEQDGSASFSESMYPEDDNIQETIEIARTGQTYGGDDIEILNQNGRPFEKNKKKGSTKTFIEETPQPKSDNTTGDIWADDSSTKSQGRRRSDPIPTPTKTTNNTPPTLERIKPIQIDKPETSIFGEIISVGLMYISHFFIIILLTSITSASLLMTIITNPIFPIILLIADLLIHKLIKYATN